MKHGFALTLALFAACSSTTKKVANEGETGPTSARSGGDGALIGSEDCDGLVILTVTPESVEIDRVARSVPLEADGTPYRAALMTELEPADPEAACAHAVDITARGDVTYQDLVAVMDIAVSAGRSEISLFGREKIGYPTRRRPKQPSDQEVIDAIGKPPFDAATLPIAVITTTSIELRINGAKAPIVIDDQAPLGDESAMQGLQEQLREARSAEAAGTGGVLVLQADRATPAALVIETSNAMRAAGYEQIMFAVKTKP